MDTERLDCFLKQRILIHYYFYVHALSIRVLTGLSPMSCKPARFFPGFMSVLLLVTWRE